MMGLTPGPMVWDILHCILMILLVVIVSWGLEFFLPTGVKYKCNVFSFSVFVPKGAESKGGRLIKMFWRSNS